MNIVLIILHDTDTYSLPGSFGCVSNLLISNSYTQDILCLGHVNNTIAYPVV